MGGYADNQQGAGIIAARIEELPILPLHRKLFGQVAIGLFFDVFDLYVAAAVSGALVASGWADLAQIAPLTSMTLAGMVVGGLAAGIIGDRFGRRLAFRFGLVIVGMSSLVAAAAPDITVLIGARMFTGFGLGMESVLAYAAFGEFLSHRYRGRWLGLVALTSNLGVVAAALAGYFIIPAFGWRWLFVIGAIGAAVGWFVRRSMPESPRWLEIRGRHEEAAAELAKFGELAIAPFAPIRSMPSEIRPEPNAGSFPKSMVVAITMSATIYISIFAFLTWLPSMMVAAGQALPKSLLMNLFMSCGALIGTATGGLISDKLGRRQAIVLLALATAGFGLAFPHALDAVWQTVIGFCMYATVYALSVASVSIYAPELFATAVRLRGVGVATASGRAFALSVPFVLP